jgi:hypothetical protein
VRTVEQIVEQIRSFSGADFAFVLTRKGRLVTHRAPREMPEEGRNRLVRTAKPLIGTYGIAEITVPREDLVPYGGAAPVDVYMGVAAEQAIVCVVMATWADKMRVGPALAAGLKAIEPLLKRGLPSVKRPGDVGPAKGSPFLGDRRTRPPPAFSRVPLIPRVASAPEIHVGEAELGRMSAAAIRHEVEATPSSPEIVYGEATLGQKSLAAVQREIFAASSIPDIVVTGEATLGRETMAAIDMDGKPRFASSPEAIRLDLVSLPEGELGLQDGETKAAAAMPGPRATVPWVELPAYTKRAADAATVGRKLAPPKVTLKLEDADDSLLDAARAEVAQPDKR